jgi:gamma-tubulin complex component 5
MLGHSDRHSPDSYNADRHSSPVTITRTVEAFADAVDAELRIFDQWCAAREEDMCCALNGTYSDDKTSPQGLVVSLLNTEKAVRDRFGRAFFVLLDVVRSIVPELVDDQRAALQWMRTRSPSVVVAALMDALFARAQEHIERGEEADTFTGGVLMRVFVHAAEPVWNMIGDWLRDGMGVGIGTGNQDEGKLNDEFFIESSGLGLGMMGSGLLDPDFWKEGYTLREGVEFASSETVGQEIRTRAIPMFLEHVAEPVLGAGKAVGLLRVLGILSPTDSQNQWASFGSLVSSSNSDSERRSEKLFAVSVDTLSRLIYDELTPRCRTAGALLANVLVEECALWGHLKAMEDLYFMRRGDAMSHFTDLVFAKVTVSTNLGFVCVLIVLMKDGRTTALG